MNLVHVVDDNPGIRESLHLLLEGEGFQVRTHASARDFLNCVGSDDQGCVLADMSMPALTGLQLLAELDRLRISLPVIIVTGDCSLALAVKAMKTGAADVIEKPFKCETLLAAVQSALADRCDLQMRKVEIQSAREKLATLSSRQREALASLAGWINYKNISSEFVIGAVAVEVDIEDLLAKLHARSQSELVRTAVLATYGCL